MLLPIYFLNAFTDTLFHGNAAAVVILPNWLSEPTLQAIARENNQPTTAFLVATPDNNYAIRWLTPETELELCGHATLASGYILFKYFHPESQQITLFANDCKLQILRQQDLITLAFPIKAITECPIPPVISQSLGVTPKAMYRHQNERCLLILDSESTVRNLKPDMQPLKTLAYRGFTITAPGTQVDFVSRTFYPNKAIPEDMVTGAAHCLLMPYWSQRLSKTQLTAHQASARGGDLVCELQNNRVLLSGEAVLYLQGHLIIPD